jgi:hypothetical protein
MNTFQQVKKEVETIGQEISGLLEQIGSLAEEEQAPFGEWSSACRCIAREAEEDVVRIAVVGAIKSGKSTFVNAMLKGDYLKRGAGVVTSIVTRIRRGDSLEARLLFKTWDEVNQEMEQALVLFPDVDWRSEKNYFDIRRAQERQDLAAALESLNADLLITNDTRNVNAVLLESYLKGYEAVKISWPPNRWKKPIPAALSPSIAGSWPMTPWLPTSRTSKFRWIRGRWTVAWKSPIAREAIRRIPFI